MDGLVPVTKASLLTMISFCRVEIDSQYNAEIQKYYDRFVTKEIERSSTKKWYRLWKEPKPRFSFTKDAVIEYSNTLERPMLEYCPFKAIENDKKNSLRWLKELENIGTSDYAGEPIQIDIKTFKRLSSPARYFWVRASSFYFSFDN